MAQVPVSEREAETLICDICGATAKSISGIRIHKGQLHKAELSEAGYVPVHKKKKEDQSKQETVQETLENYYSS